jgi:hypothetical protein
LSKSAIASVFANERRRRRRRQIVEHPAHAETEIMRGDLETLLLKRAAARDTLADDLVALDGAHVEVAVAEFELGRGLIV